MDWHTWHEKYDRPDSPLANRLRTVQERIRVALDQSPPGPLRVVSLCAGQGRDILGVLAGHPRRGDVQARLVELSAENVATAAESATAAGLDQVEVVRGDAGLADHYRDMAPADLVLVCGVFGNVVDEDIERIVDACSRLCTTAGTVVWTRNRKAPDRVPRICDWFEARGFEREWLTAPDEVLAVGAHRFRGRPRPLESGTRLFTFVGYDVLRPAGADT